MSPRPLKWSLHDDKFHNNIKLFCKVCNFSPSAAPWFLACLKGWLQHLEIHICRKSWEFLSFISHPQASNYHAYIPNKDQQKAVGSRWWYLLDTTTYLQVISSQFVSQYKVGRTCTMVPGNYEPFPCGREMTHHRRRNGRLFFTRTIRHSIRQLGEQRLDFKKSSIHFVCFVGFAVMRNENVDISAIDYNLKKLWAIQSTRCC